MTYVPGWFVDPSLPTIPEDAPRCDHCDRRLTDMTHEKANGGKLPRHHGDCDRTRDDLMVLVYRMQRDAAGIGRPALDDRYHWEGSHGYLRLIRCVA